jgi:hypothetical protein
MNTNNIRTIATGKAFGVINVFTNQGEYEIATFRHDIGSDGRRPDSVKFTNIEGMLKDGPHYQCTFTILRKVRLLTLLVVLMILKWCC